MFLPLKVLSSSSAYKNPNIFNKGALNKAKNTVFIMSVLALSSLKKSIKFLRPIK